MTRYHESPFEIRHLRSFVAVLDELNFGRAAAELHVSQSTLSERIGQLEKLLGIQLLVRSQGVIATEAASSGGVPARGANAAASTASRSTPAALTRGGLS
jgi:DNA-binding transcriptional LysR family regulator